MVGCSYTVPGSTYLDTSLATMTVQFTGPLAIDGSNLSSTSAGYNGTFDFTAAQFTGPLTIDNLDGNVSS